jgi:hypothetical protein
MANFTLIRIPKARAEQLRALARRRNTTMTGVIDEVVKRAMIEGEIADETPGLGLRRLSSGDLEILIGQERCIVYSQRVKYLLRWLNQVAVSAKAPSKFEGYAQSLEIRRAETALVLEIKNHGKLKASLSMTGSMSEDIHRQIVAAYRNYKWVSLEAE